MSDAFDKRAADALADEVAVLVRRRVIDSRSPAADALLDYRDPPATPRADRLAALETGLRGIIAKISWAVERCARHKKNDDCPPCERLAEIRASVERLLDGGAGA